MLSYVPYEIYNLQVFSPNPWVYLFIFLSTGVVKNTILAEIVNLLVNLGEENEAHIHLTIDNESSNG